LDPTEVILGPQPVTAAEREEARVISGEVVGGRHRARRGRPAAHSAVGTAVLTATGVAVGLGLLLSNESPDAVSTRSDEPAKSAPDAVADHKFDPVLAAAVAAVPATPGEPTRTAGSAATGPTASTLASTVASPKRSAGTGTTPDSGRHARASGSWDSTGWQEALERATAAQRSAAQAPAAGRHRAGGGGYQQGPAAPGEARGREHPGQRPGQGHGRRR
jgi:hypothetical protein